MLLSSISIFISVFLKITSTELPVSTRIRDTSQSVMVSVITSGSLCEASNPVVSWLLKMTRRCLLRLLVVLFLAATGPSAIAATLGG